MAKYRKKPVVIEAIRLTKENVTEISKMEDVTVYISTGLCGLPKGILQLATIKTLEGEMIAQPGDWIITGIKGERYPCKDDIFRETYEPVN